MRAPALVLLATVACAGSTATTTPAPSSGPAATPPRTGMTVPGTAGAFRLANRRNYDDPRMGSQFRFMGPDSAYADLFLYPGPDLDTLCNLQCGQRLLDQEVESFTNEALPEMVRRGTIARYQVDYDSVLTPADGAAWKLGRHVKMQLAVGGRTDRSDFYVWYFARTRAKVRVSYVETPERTRQLDAFVDALLRALSTPPGGPARENAVRRRTTH